MEKTLEQVIGANVARLREKRQWTQTQLGDVLSNATGRKWERQAVWAAENGKRAFVASDLIALADALDVLVSELISSVEPVRVGDAVIEPDRLLDLTTAGTPEVLGLWRVYLAAEALCESMQRIQSQYRSMTQELRVEAARSPELRNKVEDHLNKAVQGITEGLRPAWLEGKLDGAKHSPDEDFAAWMWSNPVPALETARAVLGEGKSSDGEGD